MRGSIRYGKHQSGRRLGPAPGRRCTVADDMLFCALASPTAAAARLARLEGEEALRRDPDKERRRAERESIISHQVVPKDT